MRHPFFCLALAAATPAAAAGADLIEARGTGLRVPRGFMAERVAEVSLTGEIHALTLDRFGRMVVTGPGSLRTLGDQNNDRRADLAVPVATVRTAGWGLAAAGPDLWWTGDDAVWRFRDADGDGQADGPGERVLPISTGPNAAHALALGPDGFLHVAAGFGTAFTNATHAGDPASPFAAFEAGAVLRLTDGGRAQAWAVGLRNPRGLAFSAAGPLLAWDAEDPRETFLPWSLPTRLVEVPAGLRQGWLRADEAGSWSLPERRLDGTEALARAAGAAPGGLTVYRHEVLPAEWRGAVLAADAANGRVLAFRPPPDGDGAAQTEILLQGAPGVFQPVAVAVAPDGGVLVAAGGTGPGAGIFRVAPLRPADDTLLAQAQLAAARPLEGVLRAPQPLAAWSMTRWRPAAEALGRGAFLEAAGDARRSPAERLRAVEVATQLFGGLDETTAGALLRDASPELRARAAWSVGVTGPPFLRDALAALLADASPAVRREAAGALLLRRLDLPPEAVALRLAALLDDPDLRVRRIAVSLVARLDEAARAGLWARRGTLPPSAQLTLGFGVLRARPPGALQPDLVELGLGTLPRLATTSDRLLAVLLVQAGLGHGNFTAPSRRALAAFEPAAGDDAVRPYAARIAAATRPLLRPTEPALDLEAARLLAMVRDPAAATLRASVSRLGPQTAPGADFHHLAVLARLPAARSNDVTLRLADAVLNLGRKLGPGEPLPVRRWPEALAEVTAVLAARDPGLGAALAGHPRLLDPAHVPLAAALPPPARAAAGRRFAVLLPTRPQFPWTPELVALLAAADDAAARALLRRRADEDATLRPAVLRALSAKPSPDDRDLLLAGLADKAGRGAALEGLGKLPPETRGTALAQMLGALRRAMPEPEPEGRAFREGLAAQVGRARGDGFTVTESTDDPAARAALYAPLFAWFAENFPAEARKRPGS